ncbi:MAG: hypothetical protein ACLQAT_01850 [Candidatus Binataceae bacterium]
MFSFVALTPVHAQDLDEAKKPSPITQVEGSWSGMDTDDDMSGNSNSGPMTLDLNQTKKKVTGSYTFTDAEGEDVGGSETGSISGDTFTFTFHQSSGSEPHCHGTGVATVDGDTMSGSFVVSHSPKPCGGSGTFDLKQQ